MKLIIDEGANGQHIVWQHSEVDTLQSDVVNGISVKWDANITYNQKEVLHSLINNMIHVEGGSFMMGTDANPIKYVNRIANPRHIVTLGDFYLSKFQLTQSQWEIIMGNNPAKKKENNLPIENVSYEDALLYIEKLNKLTGLSFRLPTEAEWEYAARGGNKSQNYQYSGSNDYCEVGWCSGFFVAEVKHCVGTKRPNELGFYDMTGNVWEWCNDFFDKNYYSYSPQNNPQGPDRGSARVIRGGSCKHHYSLSKVFVRVDLKQHRREPWLGFRLAL